MTTAKELRAYSEWAGRPPVLEIAADMLVLQAEEIERLKDERDALRKDAERWRFLEAQRGVSAFVDMASFIEAVNAATQREQTP